MLPAIQQQHPQSNIDRCNSKCMCRENLPRNLEFLFPIREKMLIVVGLFSIVAEFCSAMRLSPLENNEMLQDISNQYVAEMQWESWPVKQGSFDQGKSPGARVNVGLWKDSSGSNWYLFGGKPVSDQSNKVFSDVWKYSADNRMWERFFPSQSEIKGANAAKIGGIMTLRANLFEEGHTVNNKIKNYTIVLCGEVTKNNATKMKKQNVWNNFTRRKKLKEEKHKEEPKSLAVYSPNSKSNAVWQIDLKDKLWTAYICCCETNYEKTKNSTYKGNNTFSTVISSTTEERSQINSNFSLQKNLSSLIDSKISKIEDEMSNEKLRFNMSNLKVKKKKINQSKTGSETDSKNIKKVEKRNNHKKEEEEDMASATSEEYVTGANNTLEPKLPRLDVKNKTSNKSKKEKYNLKMMAISKTNKTGEMELKEKNKTKKIEEEKLNMASKYCPEFSEGGETITWCDGHNEVLVSAVLEPTQITFWIFNLKASHWYQEKMKKPDDINWSECLNSNSIRYAGNKEEAFIICSPIINKVHQATEVSLDYASPSKNPSTESLTVRRVFRLNYKLGIVESLGDIRLHSFFDTAEGQQVWKSETKSSFHVFCTSENETMLFMAYLDSLDLWILTNDQKGKPRFELIEKIWRGSALKWFNKYNAALYNFQVVTENENKSETILMPNPRITGASEYWPRDRGRFIIRIFKNENLKNQSFENKTREQNLTYELLQSDYKPPTAENNATHAYNLKVLLFFGISLAIFAVFGFVIFLKRCVSCPPTVRETNECHKSPLVIRYSVIPDDLLYPVA